MKFLNDGRKELKAWEKNWFFVTTVVIVVLNIVLHAALGSRWGIDTDNDLSDWQLAQGFMGQKSHWSDFLYFKSLLQVFLSNFSHFNWQHTLLNMLCFAVCGVYLERKIGSLSFFLLILGFALFTSSCVAANNNSINFHGYSGVNYALYAYIIVDYIFTACSKAERDKFRLIAGAVMLGLIYFAACFNGGTVKVSFALYPYDLCYNLGHYTSFVTGAVLSVVIKGIKAIAAKKARC